MLPELQDSLRTVAISTLRALGKRIADVSQLGALAKSITGLLEGKVGGTGVWEFVFHYDQHRFVILY